MNENAGLFNVQRTKFKLCKIKQKAKRYSGPLVILGNKFHMY